MKKVSILFIAIFAFLIVRGSADINEYQIGKLNKPNKAGYWLTKIGEVRINLSGMPTGNRAIVITGYKAGSPSQKGTQRWYWISFPPSGDVVIDYSFK